MVSPTLASATVLMEAEKKPTWEGGTDKRTNVQKSAQGRERNAAGLDLAGAELVDADLLGGHDAELVDLVVASARHQLHLRGQA
jgi:hypothetical protein